MAKKKKAGEKSRKTPEKLKWEVAEELNLDDDLLLGGDDLTVKEAGKIGGNVTRKLVEKGKGKFKTEK